MLGIGDSVFASCCIELRGFAAKIPQTVETTVKKRVLSRYALRSVVAFGLLNFKSF